MEGVGESPPFFYLPTSHKQFGYHPETFVDMGKLLHLRERIN